MVLPMGTRLTISFCYDLTAPNARCVDIAHLTLKGDEFVAFAWTKDPKTLGMNAFAQAIVAGQPDYLKILVQEEWPAFRDRAERRSWDPTTAADFVAHTMRHSSVYVSAIEPTP